MQATLIYNEGAGSTSQATTEELLTALQGAGYEPVCPATTSEEELDDVLRSVRGLVVAAGGDGTVRAVAKRLLDKPAALAILPMGTMNNIALTLGLTEPPLALIAGLRNPSKHPLDVGRATGSWGVEYFLEGAGFGFFADLLANAQPHEKSLIGSITSLAKALVNFPNYACRLRWDEQTQQQEVRDNFVMVEVLNTKSIGPWLRFAPNADPGDGWLDLIRIRAGEEVSMLQYVTNLLSEGLHELPTVEVERVRSVELELVAAHFHIDDQVQFDPAMSGNRAETLPTTGSPSSHSSSSIKIEVLAQAIELWLPEPTSAQPQV